MNRIRLTVAYDGTDFHGFARQRGLRTVQGTLEDLVSRAIGQEVEVFGSGRTDAGVHARAQVVHWDQSQGPPADKYPFLLNRMFPRDLVALEAEFVPTSFHARFSVQRKTYRYTLQRSFLEDVFTKRYAWHVREPLDIAEMEHAAKYLMGRHDFSSFCAGASPVIDKVRTLHDVSIAHRDSYLDVYCTGNGFLQYMVRIIVGTLVDVGAGRMAAASIPSVLQAQDRRVAGQTAPPHGLSLWRVDYGESANR